MNAPRFRRKKAVIIADAEPLPARLAAYVPESAAVTNRFARKLAAEMKLTLAGVPRLWYLAALGALAAEALLPLRTAQMILPLILLWPLSVYSALGCREHQHGTRYLVAVLPSGLSRQMARSWLCGILLSLAMLCPALIRMLAAGEFAGVLVCLCGAVFVPALALFLGEWTRTRRAFEVVYVSLAYVVMNGVTSISYLEVRPEYLSLARAAMYMALGIALGVLAVMKRARSFHTHTIRHSRAE
jgi:hypothetical protein